MLAFEHNWPKESKATATANSIVSSKIDLNA